MEYRQLGRTALQISVIAFGAGPVSGWMAEPAPDAQREVVRRAIELGINWFDTAANYGDGRSERSLGAALASIDSPGKVIHVATKVRFLPEQLHDIKRHAWRSLAASLERLKLTQVTLLQLHNSITATRGDEPTSVAPEDVLGAGGILEAFQEIRAQGLTRFLGLTGIGQAAALRQVVGSGAFHTMQVPYSLLNPSAGQSVPDSFPEANYGNIIADCAEQQMGVLAIRVFAGGALLGSPPSAHTLKTPFFPLALYARDRERAELFRDLLGPKRDLKADAVRFVLGHADVSSAIIGFREPGQVDEVVSALDEAMPPGLVTLLRRIHELPLGG